MKLQNYSFGLVSGDPEEESPIFILVLAFGCNQNLRETSDFFATKCLMVFCVWHLSRVTYGSHLVCS